MCNSKSFEKWAGKPHDWSLNRRQFTALGAASVLAACSSAVRGENAALALAEDEVSIITPDGTIDAYFVRPASGAHPAILTWPDIAGLREAFRVMARRLAGQGYAVLTVNPYYRDLAAPQFEDFAAFFGNDGFQTVRPWREQLTSEAIMRDAVAAIGWLDARDEVDTARGVGTHGYCMGGPFTVWTAAAVPDRVRAAASLHGGGLVREDDPQSPHNLIAGTQASYLIAYGQDDDERDPEAKTVLREVADAAGRSAEIEIYNADHGWTVLDSPVYDQAEAERAWTRMSALFETNL